MGERLYLGKNRDYYSRIILFVIIALVIVYIYLILNNKTNLLFSPGEIPSINFVNILSEQNLSEETLFGYCNPGDADSDDENLSCDYIWYKNNINVDSGSFNCTRGENNVINISGSIVSVGNWTFSCVAYDGFNYSSQVNSSAIEIDSLPLIVFNSQTSLGSLKQNFIILNISGLDNNLDRVEVKLYNSSELIYQNYSSNEVYAYLLGLNDGTYTLNVSANDILGHVNLATRTIELDNAAPVFRNLQHSALEYGVSVSSQIVVEDLVSGVDCIRFVEGINSYFNISCDGLLVNKTVLPMGINWINLSVNDSVGNVGTGSFYISVSTQRDVFVPIIYNITIAYPSISSAILSWLTNEVSDSRIIYGINSSLSSTSYSATQLVSHSFNLDNLLNNTQYFFNISSCDSSGNCGIYSSNFTTSAPASAGNGPNDTTDDPEVFSASYSSLVSGYEKRGLISGDKIILSKSTSNADKYNLTIVSIGTSSIRVKINNQASFSISLGVNQRIDVNSDGTNDFDLLLRNSNDSRANIFITLIVPSGSGGGNVGSGQNYTNLTGGNQENPEGDSDSSAWAYILWALIIVIVLSLIILFVLKKKEISDFFNSHFSKRPSESYIRTIDMIKSAEIFVQNGQRDKASAIYGLIRNLFPTLRANEREMLKPRVLRLFGLISKR